MLNMIVTVIAIALVVTLTATAVFFGGDAWTDNKIEAEAAQYRNEAMQIAGAVRLFKAQGNSISSNFTLQELVEKEYLDSLPEGWEPGVDVIMKTLDQEDPASEEICFEANKQSKFTFSALEESVQTYSKDESYGIPHCDKENLDALVPCCVNPDTPEAPDA